MWSGDDVLTTTFVRNHSNQGVGIVNIPHSCSMVWYVKISQATLIVARGSDHSVDEWISLRNYPLPSPSNWGGIEQSCRCPSVPSICPCPCPWLKNISALRLRPMVTIEQQSTNRKLMLEVELTGQRGRVATTNGQNIPEAEKRKSSISWPNEIQPYGYYIIRE